MADAPIRSLLLVDDFLPDVRYASLMLRRSGRFHHVMTVASAEEALRLFDEPEAAAEAHPEAFPPDAMLLDINMPGMDGFELLEALAERSPEVRCPVIMLSSSLDGRDKRRALAFDQVVGYACKPLSVDEAHAIADRLVTWREAPRARSSGQPEDGRPLEHEVHPPSE